jgi:hypothetical protein
MSESISRRRFLVAGASVLAVGAAALVGGTYAKYTTSGAGSGSAKVAEFGAAVSAGGDLFAKTYISGSAESGANGPGSDGSTVTVSSTSETLAPGTANSTGVTFSFSGASQVDVKVTAKMTSADGMSESAADVFLKAGEYADYTSADLNAKFTLSSDYYPVAYALKKGDTTLVSGNLTKIEEYLESTSTTKTESLTADLGTVSAGTDLSTAIGALTLTWAWDFNGSGTNDAADTLLGKIAKGGA